MALNLVRRAGRGRGPRRARCASPPTARATARRSTARCGSRRARAPWSSSRDASRARPLLSEEGWPYASPPPVEAGDPGRFHALFGRDSLITSLQVLPARPDVARATLRALARAAGPRARIPRRSRSPARSGTSSATPRRARFVASGWPARGPVRLLRHRRRHLVVPGRCSRRPATARSRTSSPARGARPADWLEGALERGGGFVRYAPRAPRAASASRAGATRSTRSRPRIDGGILRAGRHRTGVAARRRRHAGGGARGAARAGAAVGRGPLGAARRGAARAARRARAGRDGGRARRHDRARRGLPARLAAVGRRARRATRARRPPRGCASPTC